MNKLYKKYIYEEEEDDGTLSSQSSRHSYHDTEKEIKIVEKQLKDKKAAINVYHDFKTLYSKDWREKLKEYLPLVADKTVTLYFYLNYFQKETLEYICESTNYEIKKNILLFGLHHNLFYKVNFSKEEKEQYINDLIEETVGTERQKTQRQLTFLFKEIKPEQWEKILTLTSKEETHIMNLAQFLFINTKENHKNNNYLLEKYSQLLLKDIEVIKVKEYLKIKSSIVSWCYNEEYYMKVLPFAQHFARLQESDKSYVTACVIKYLSPKNEKSIKYFQYIDNQRLQEIKSLCNHNKSKNEFFDLMLEKKLLDTSISKDGVKNNVYKL